MKKNPYKKWLIVIPLACILNTLTLILPVITFAAETYFPDKLTGSPSNVFCASGKYRELQRKVQRLAARFFK